MAAVAWAYGNGTSGAFVFDDFAHIHHDERIHSLRSPWDLLASERRPIVALSLAVNYAMGGLRAEGYHLFNLAVHVLAALTMFGVVRRTMLSDRFGPDVARDASLAALATALIWAVHPLQTQSVIYIIQRGESMMGLFYLLTLYCLIRGAGSRRAAVWYAGAIVCCALGMGTKAVMVSAPVVALLYDRTFISGSFREAARRRWPLYLGLGATWSVVVLCGVAGSVLSTTAVRHRTVGLGVADITQVQYAMTQPGVILQYIKLALWPRGLCFDYAWPIARSAAAEAGPLVAVGTLAALTVWGVIRRSWLGFAGAWFLVVLAPTSSIIPIRDPLVEHRMYLSLAAVVLVVVLGTNHLFTVVLKRRRGGHRRATRMKAMAVLLAVLTLAAATRDRNEVYASRVALWRDVVAKRPDNARAHLNLGVAIDDAEEAMREYRAALRIKPDYADAYYNIGRIHAELGQVEQAINAYRTAVELDPLLASAQFNLANALNKRGNVDEAISAYRAAIEAKAKHFGARVNLGIALASRGDFTEAELHLGEAARIDPASPEPHVNLGEVYIRLRKPDRAAREFQTAIRLLQSGGRRAFRADVHYRLGTVLETLGRIGEAAAHYTEALRLDGGHQRARRALDVLSGRDGSP